MGSPSRIGKQGALLSLVLLYAVIFRLLVVARPFQYDAEGSGSLYAVLARNYLRFDWVRTWGMPVLTVGDASSAPLVFYPDHPPLVPLLIVPFYSLFGVGEWQTRLPFSLLTVAAIYLVYRLLSRWGTPRVALLSAALFAASPMTLYFGGFAEVVGLPLLFCVLLVLTAYMPFHREPAVATLVPLVLAFALAGVCDWPAYIMVPVLLCHFVWTRPGNEWGWIVVFCVVASVEFAALYAYIALATGSAWDWMVPLLSRRSAIGVTPFTLGQWLSAAAAFNRRFHTLPLLAASGLWIVLFAFRRRGSEGGGTVARILLAWGALHMVIGAKAMYDHEWWWSPLTPGVAVSGALLIERALGVVGCRWSGRAVGWAVALLVALFAAWTGRSTYRDLYPLERDEPYSPMDLGRAIQAAAPDRADVAMLVGGEGEAQLWFYGDRALRIRVWTIDEFERRLQGESAELVFDFDVQPWPGPATGLVFPKVWDEGFEPFRAYLDERYPPVALPAGLAEKFDVFDLRQVRPGR